MKKEFKILILLILTISDSITACNCRIKAALNLEFKKSDIIFIGSLLPEERFTEKELPFGYNVNDYIHVYHFIVTKAYKGTSENDTVTIISDNSTCGFQFLNSKSYIVYGRTNFESRKFSKESRTFWTDNCTRTCVLNFEEEEELNSITR